MKKRSLFAAVAMLIVSAIVLTSATYAWFAASNSANVEDIYASVQNTDGSVLLQADYYVRSTSYGYTQAQVNAASSPVTTLSADNYNPFPGALHPISLGVQTAATSSASAVLSLKKVTYDSASFASTSAPVVNKAVGTDEHGDPTYTDGDYLRYGFKVLYSASSATTENVNLKPILTTQTGTASKFGYVLVRVKPVVQNTSDPENVTAATASVYTDYWYCMNPAANTNANNDGGYTPLLAINTTIKDNKTAAAKIPDVVDSTDTLVDGSAYTSTDVTLGTHVLPSAFTASGTVIPVIPSGCPAGDYEADVEVYIWAEGNDPDCHGTITTDYAGIKFDVKLGEFA